VISSAGSYLPAGYSQGSLKQLFANETGLLSSSAALYSNPSGAFANMTVLVFGSQASALAYIHSVISNARALSGYSNTNSTLTGYQTYGTCFGYAQSDPEGQGSVANGVCTKGNVYIQVHLASTSSLTSAEDDLSSFVGAAYRGLG
jgi:hypothetical protein